MELLILQRICINLFFLPQQTSVPNQQKLICRKIDYLNCQHTTLIQFFDLKGTRHKPFIQTSVNRMSQLAYVSALSISKNISLSSRSHDPFKHGLLRPRLFGESTGFQRWAYLEIALIKTRAASTLLKKSQFSTAS